MISRLILCLGCGRRHLPESMIRDPDNPARLLCPVRSRGVMRLSAAERAESERLLRSVFGAGDAK
jgi:hypothetical protein